MKKLSLFILASSFIFGGSQQLYAAQQEHNHQHSANSEEKAIDGLSLNHGKRWEMDKHTRIMSVKMNDTFFNSDHSTLASLNFLGIKLEKQLEQHSKLVPSKYDLGESSKPGKPSRWYCFTSMGFNLSPP